MKSLPSGMTGGSSIDKRTLVVIIKLNPATSQSKVLALSKGQSTLYLSGWSMNLLTSSDETLDTFFNGRLQIVQKKKGYRFSVDAILLSQFTKIRKNENVIDLGTGCGILPLLLSQTTEANFLVGVEIQKGLAECAEKNVFLNHLGSRISILKQDFRDLKRTFPPGSFDVVLSNPPYRRYRTGRINPSTEKAVARHEIRGTLGDLITIASYLLPPKGRCYLIFPVLRTVDLLVALRGAKLEPKRLQFVHPRVAEEAKFILIESIKGGGVELKIMDPLILHETYGAEASVLNGKNKTF